MRPPFRDIPQSKPKPPCNNYQLCCGLTDVGPPWRSKEIATQLLKELKQGEYPGHDPDCDDMHSLLPILETES